jgi:agmatine deiminase
VNIGGTPWRFVLEGGSIDVDGEGSVLTTRRCLLGTGCPRNPGLDQAGTEQVLRDYLGVSNVIWLEDGIAGDDTSGHIDDFARFVAPGRVVIAREKDERDPNHALLEAAREELLAARDAQGRRLEVIDLPMPAPLSFDGERLPASYANFYIANESVLVPTFNDPNDRVALGILAELFPTRRVCGVHAVDLVVGLGTLHCSTQQQPR